MARTVTELLTITADFFQKKGIESPRLDAELLLGEVLGLSRIQLYTHFDQPLQEAELDEFRELVRRRGKREPVAYILGRKEFFGRDFIVTHDTLVPQPDTEILVETAVTELKKYPPENPLKVVDLCTGTGAIAVTVALEMKGKAMVTATDISSEALAVAKQNVEALAADAVTFRQGDLFGALKPGEKYIAILSNPPYIRKDEMASLLPEVQAEPELALCGGVDGLDFYRRLIAEAPDYLEPGGFMAVEIGAEQGEQVAGLARAAGAYLPESINIIRDLAGHPRVVIMKKKS
ncbi:MAG: peptide chain release factor N(5)-glutamine methyltransferase [Selenomonadaceae bacterium]|nr:peptide chain release factor N(5)-glutamine methyltransferase [Selenomonadaceae bacterium]